MPLRTFLTADGLSEDLATNHGIPLSAERLNDLAEMGYIPHYHVDGGPPLFDPDEAKERIDAYFVKKHNGHPRPWELSVFDPAEMTAHRRPVPQSLSMLHDRLWEIPTAPFRWPPGVYFLIDGAEIVYVGKSTFVLQRLLGHIREKPFERILFLPTPAEDLSRLETEFIRRFRPRLNFSDNLSDDVPAYRTTLEVLLDIEGKIGGDA